MQMDLKAGEDKPRCGICTYKAGEEPKECSICKLHLCKGVRAGQTACSQCIEKAIESGAMQKNDKGQWLDPAKRTPLPTCKCGKFLGPMSDCIFKGLYGDANHLPIQ